MDYLCGITMNSSLNVKVFSKMLIPEKWSKVEVMHNVTFLHSKQQRQCVKNIFRPVKLRISISNERLFKYP